MEDFSSLRYEKSLIDKLYLFYYFIEGIIYYKGDGLIMKITILTSSPNKEGLTAACALQAKAGAEESGAEVALICLNELNIASCKACNDGWGICKDKHSCGVEDDFKTVQKEVRASDGLIIVTPVYWGEMSESAKVFLDKLRRCEATNGEENSLLGKPILCVAAAGGSGNGTISCLESMERFVNHLKGVKYDFISVTRKNKEYKLSTIRAAAKSLCDSLKL